MEEKHVFVAIGIFMVLAVLTFFVMITYLVSKLVLPMINGRRNEYILLSVFYIILAFGVSKCMLFAYALIFKSLG
jgi:hypothetical protein